MKVSQGIMKVSWLSIKILTAVIRYYVKVSASNWVLCHSGRTGSYCTLQVSSNLTDEYNQHLLSVHS